MNRVSLITVVSLVLIAAGAATYVAVHHHPILRPAAKTQTSPPAKASSGSTSSSASSSQSTQTSTSDSNNVITSKSTHVVNGQTTIYPVTVTVSIDDNPITQTVNVLSGAAVTVVFNIQSSFALNFQSSNPDLSTGELNPGSSKTIQFTASDTTTFTASSGSKNYSVTIAAN